MNKEYVVVEEFYHRNVLREVGDKLVLAPAQVKYLGHLVKESEPAVEVAPAPKKGSRVAADDGERT
jgi:hypothetical protein